VTIPRVYKTDAIVLRRSNLGEADKILTLYTPNLGKIRAIAKGVRRPTSKLGGHVELLTHCSLMLARGPEAVNDLPCCTFRQIVQPRQSKADSLFRSHIVAQRVSFRILSMSDRL